MNLGQIFENNFDCYSDTEEDVDKEMAMTKSRFVEVVQELIAAMESKRDFEDLEPSIFDGTNYEGDHEWVHVCESCARRHGLSTSDSCIDGNICLVAGCRETTSLVHYLWDDRQ